MNGNARSRKIEYGRITLAGLTQYPPFSPRKRGEETLRVSPNLPPFTGGMRGVVRKSCLGDNLHTNLLLIRTAHALYSGIFAMGSTAGLVSRFAAAS